MSRSARPGTLPLDANPIDGPGEIERSLVRAGLRWALGTDEAGRGPLAGPVVAAAVALDLHDLAWCDGLDDSKRLSDAARRELFVRIRERASAVRWCVVDPSEIDAVNILQASLAGMRRSVRSICSELGAGPGDRGWGPLLVDGRQRVPGLEMPQDALVRGDARSYAVAAASIVAKVVRDDLCFALDAEFPGWGFAKHKGYPTPAHLERLREHGPCSAHRRSFAPVRRALEARARGEGCESE